MGKKEPHREALTFIQVSFVFIPSDAPKDTHLSRTSNISVILNSEYSVNCYV